MTRKQILLNAIGTIHTPFNDIKDMPIQPIAAEGIKGTVEVLHEYTKGLIDLDGFTYITLLYHFHKTHGYNLKVKPFMDNKEHGLFATRSPKRPNAIGLSTVKLIKIENNIIHFEMADMLNGSPLLDIKPFFSQFDNRKNGKNGWLDQHKELSADMLRSDDRFGDKEYTF